MAIVVTDVSRSGVVMCTDSRLSNWYPSKNTMAILSDEQRKIERLDGIGVSYWGYVEYIIEPGRDINLWIRREWEKAGRPSTPSVVADLLATQARLRWERKARLRGESIGFHVAGYEPWENGGPPKPVIYHVHNGHGHYKRHATGDGTFRIEWKPAPPHEIESNRDFPDGASKNSEKSPDELLETGWTLRNGDFYITAEVLGAYLTALRRVMVVGQYRQEPLALGARESLLCSAVELAVKSHKAFRQPGTASTVGGPIISESFRWPHEKDYDNQLVEKQGVVFDSDHVVLPGADEFIPSGQDQAPSALNSESLGSSLKAHGVGVEHGPETADADRQPKGAVPGKRSKNV